MADTIPTAEIPGGSPEQTAARALQCYLNEDYDGAANGFEAALAAAPDRADWRDLLEKARVNAHARIDMPVPPRHAFTREQLLAPPGFARAICRRRLRIFRRIRRSACCKASATRWALSSRSPWRC